MLGVFFCNLEDVCRAIWLLSDTSSGIYTKCGLEKGKLHGVMEVVQERFVLLKPLYSCL